MHRALAVPAVALILAAALTGCTADDAGGILVLKNVAAGESCTTTAAEDEVGISHGSLDTLFPSDYLFIAQMRSRIVALEAEEAQRTIITSGARIDITFPGSTVFDDAELAELRESGLTRFRQLFTAPISPNNGITDAGFVLVPQALVERIALKAEPGRQFRIQLVATFTIEGSMSGQHVESQEFSYPITVGNSLSVSVLGACSSLDDSEEPRLGYSCNPFQDGVVDCCSVGADLVCPARKG
jgi:hypothetical protein